MLRQPRVRARFDILGSKLRDKQLIEQLLPLLNWFTKLGNCLSYDNPLGQVRVDKRRPHSGYMAKRRLPHKAIIP
jgi:hypothetical protein